MPPAAWLLLIYQLPSRHSPARVKVWRRLQRIGAVLLKNSAWAMPESDEAREDLEWLKAEIVASGGEAMVLGGMRLSRRRRTTRRSLSHGQDSRLRRSP